MRSQNNRFAKLSAVYDRDYAFLHAETKLVTKHDDAK